MLNLSFSADSNQITAFAGPTIAEKFYDNVGWRWGFGCFAIILPFVALPMFGNLWTHKRRAEKAGLLTKQSSGRSVPQSIWFYAVEFDRKSTRSHYSHHR